MRKTLLAAIGMISLAALSAPPRQASAQEATPAPLANAAPKGSWELLTTVQPYPHLWGVFPSSDACAAGQKQLDMQAMRTLSSMRGVTPDEFNDAVTKLNSLKAANCVQN